MSQPLPVAGAADTRRVLGRLVRRHAGGFSIAVIALALAAAATVATPLLLGEVVDAVTGAPAARTRLVPLVIALGALALAVGLLAAWSRIAVARVGERMLTRLRGEVFEHVLALPTRRVEAAGRGEVISRVTGDVAIVGETVASVLPGAASAAFLITMSAAGLGVIDPRLTLAALLAVPVQVIAVRAYLRRSQPLYRAARAASGARSQLTLEALEGRSTVIAFGIGPERESLIDEQACREAEREVEAARVGTRFWGRLNMAEFVGLGAILAVGWVIVATGIGTVGAATAAALVFMQLFGPIGTVLASFDELQRAGASLGRLVGVLEEPTAPPRPAASVSPGGQAGTATSAVTLHEAAFAYGDREVLTDVTLQVPVGGHVAIVGASGAGKTTLAALVAGELHPTRGHLSFAVEQPRVGLVSQENHVFSGTLRADLALAAPEATEAEMRHALTSAGAAWALALADGLDTVVGAGGLPLTDAQRQQVALARIALHDPDVLILDEAASEAGSLDALSSAAAHLAARYTTITIAHRLDQAASADLIVMMDAGRIVERGSHAELLAAGGAYRRLWDSWSPVDEPDAAR
ncbi:ABC transporter ATP-binding protein [Microbacterium sp. VKM Ac-2923]|uniref:ABC transporter ATP-binding protein n=1 Tax=Microbacterium sp. VKM Ac-2923 TaxID=2929476 RepID=UPI001FB421C2|nr:ABC transporter ATP-binding protein [Microbacterium sp. VKM Ac-2923]MCJ1708516.1 ABC transporter ATP-binding protein/permease [Microbacterium sp. VKM Ac-2923]